MFAGFAALYCGPVFAQALDDVPDGQVLINLADGSTMAINAKFGLPARRSTSGSGQTQAKTSTTNTSPAVAASGLLHGQLHIAGRQADSAEHCRDGPRARRRHHDNTHRSGSLEVRFPDPGNPVLDGTNVVPATVNSPIFQTADYTAGPVDIGVTQYADALQRAQFWNLPGFSQNCHVLLATPTVAPTVTIVVPSGVGYSVAVTGGRYLGFVDFNFVENLMLGVLANYSANQVVMFVSDDVLLTEVGGVAFGFHDSEPGVLPAVAKTFLYFAYLEPGVITGAAGQAFEDIEVLSHEIAEWTNDPFAGFILGPGANIIPPAMLVPGFCTVVFETGDPLETGPYDFTKVTNSTTYHLQDEVVLPWYLHSTPSFAVNGWYTFQNTSFSIPLVVNSPSSIAGSYTNTARLFFAPVRTAVTGNVVYVGRGCPAGSINGTNPDDPYLDNPSGKIALIDRGSCNASLKIDRAAQAGAIAVLLGLVAPGNARSFGFGGGTHFVPSLVITQATSNLIKSVLGGTVPVNVTISPANAIPPSFSSLCGPG